MMSRTTKNHATETLGPTPVRVAVVAGYAFLQEAIRRILDEQPAVTVVGTVGRPAEAVELVSKQKPDALLLVHTGATLDELEVIQRVAALGRGTRLLILSPETSQQASLRLLRAGAHGILAPEATTAEIVRAIQVAHRGEIYLTPKLQRAAAERYLGVDSQAAPEDRLSDREYQVMRLLALGHTNREIADLLGVGVKTIDTHRANLLRKLALRNNTDLARFAIRAGIVDC